MNNQAPLTHVYLLAMTSNTDDQYNEKNYAFRNKEDAEKELRHIFTEIINTRRNEYAEHELKKAKNEQVTIYLFNNSLILFIIVGKINRFHIFYILSDGISHNS